MPSVNATYKVIIATMANDRIQEHYEFLARVSESAANALLSTLLKDLASLQKMPLRNPVYDRPYVPVLKYRYMISGKRYRIVYQVVDDTVFVDDIQDSRQSDDKNLIGQ